MSHNWTNETFATLIDRVAECYGDRGAMVFGDRRITYRDLRNTVRQLAGGLLALGLGRGDKVAIWLPNRPEWVDTMLAAGLIGAVTVGVNTRYKPEEAAYVLRQSHARGLVLLDRFLNLDFTAMLETMCPELRAAEPGRWRCERLPDLRTVVDVGARPDPSRRTGTMAFADVLARGTGRQAEVDRAARAVRPSDPAIIQYTSGTTAFPKGAVLSHAAVIRNGFVFGERMRLDESDRYFNVAPYFHTGGSIGTVLSVLTHGGCIVQLDHFEPGQALRLIERERCTAHGGMDTVYLKEIQHPEFDRFDLSSLKKGSVGGSGEVVRAIHDRMGIKGVITIYGLSEASCNVATTDPDDPFEVRTRSAGRPHEGLEVKIVDPESGHGLPAGQEGEILVRGWSLMLGYFEKPAETAEAIDIEGWLHTGDRGYLDEAGRLTFVGRIKDVIRVGGENFAPAEVEALIAADRRVHFVQVVAAPDRVLGEVGLAFVELEAGATCTEEEIIARCRQHLAGFKVPRYVCFITDWPMTPSGKIQKYRLREQAAAWLQSVPSLEVQASWQRLK